MPKQNQGRRNPQGRGSLKTALWLLFEIIVYALFVVAYCCLVLLLLRNWFTEMFEAHKLLYAALVLPLLLTQAIVLNLVTAGLRKLGRGTPK